jgi:hypothetical protein
MSKTWKIIIACILLGIILGLCWPRPHKSGLAPSPAPSSACSAAAAPCIKLTTTDGTTYKLNDFRFGAGECIYFRSLPDATDRHFCGKYSLDWIGPDPTAVRAENT